MSMKASVSSSSNSLKHGVCPATISQKMQSGSDFIYLLSVRNRLIANSQAAHSDPSEGTSFTRSYCLSKLQCQPRCGSAFAASSSYQSGLRATAPSWPGRPDDYVSGCGCPLHPSGQTRIERVA